MQKLRVGDRYVSPDGKYKIFVKGVQYGNCEYLVEDVEKGRYEGAYTNPLSSMTKALEVHGWSLSGIDLENE